MSVAETDVAALGDRHNIDAYSPPVRTRRADRFPFAVIALVVALGVTGCGGDNDDQGGADRATQEQRAEQNHPGRAAQLETYLRRNTTDLIGSHGKPGQVIRLSRRRAAS